jgi:hypothetical protein
MPGKIDTLGSYGTVVLVAGGVGITHPIPFIRDLVAGYAEGTVATKRIVLVWVIKSQGPFTLSPPSITLRANTLQIISNGFVPG